MNDRYFACRTCKTFLDAGYRWCYWELEHPGIIQLGERVDVDRVLSHAPYWDAPADSPSDWLSKEVLPSVRQFFADHAGHDIVYWQIDDLPDDKPLNWLWIGADPLPTARYFVEVLRLKRWQDVEQWLDSSEFRDWWHSNRPHIGDSFRKSFEHYCARQ